MRLSSARSPLVEAFESVLGERQSGDCPREQAVGVLPVEGRVPSREGKRTLL